jgi:ornithine--oxo-acid transaminase
MGTDQHFYRREIPMTSNNQTIIEQTDRYGASNYHPLPIVISRAEGIWMEDVDGNRYIDMLSAYSALNYGHRHPRLLAALKEQADKVTLTSRAFHHDQLGRFYEKLAALTGKERILPMNTGAEAVETAIKAARRWAYDVKQVPKNQAEIIVCADNFHGRTITAISLSSNPEYQRGFGPLTPGFKIIPYGEIAALKAAITPNTAAFLLEPIQGEAGVIVPPAGFLEAAAQICKENNVLLVADEIQTGLGRTGQMFACNWEDVIPDIYILGKALGGGILPISAIAANNEIMNVFDPGSHGSTFGGNPLACAVATAALDVLIEEDLSQQARQLGEYFIDELRKLENPIIKEIRGKGLLLGLELHEKARPICEHLMKKGLLCKETHQNTVRFAPPLIMTKVELDLALTKVRHVLEVSK